MTRIVLAMRPDDVVVFYRIVTDAAGRVTVRRELHNLLRAVFAGARWLSASERRGATHGASTSRLHRIWQDRGVQDPLAAILVRAAVAAEVRR